MCVCVCISPNQHKPGGNWISYIILVFILTLKLFFKLYLNIYSIYTSTTRNQWKGFLEKFETWHSQLSSDLTHSLSLHRKGSVKFCSHKLFEFSCLTDFFFLIFFGENILCTELKDLILMLQSLFWKYFKFECFPYYILHFLLWFAKNDLSFDGTRLWNVIKSSL